MFVFQISAIAVGSVLRNECLCKNFFLYLFVKNGI